KAAHDRHVEADHGHLSLFVIARSLTRRTLERLRAKLVGVRGEWIPKDLFNDKWLLPLLDAACFADVGTVQDLRFVDEIRRQLRKPPREPLVSLVIFLKRAMNPVEVLFTLGDVRRVCAPGAFLSRRTSQRIEQTSNHCHAGTEPVENGNE